MAEKNVLRRARRPHVHKGVVTRAVRQRAGIPYEVEQSVCADCRRILGERPLRRAAV